MKTKVVVGIFMLGMLVISCNKPGNFGNVLNVNGDAKIYSHNEWMPLKKSSPVNYHDTIQAAGGSVEIGFVNKSKITLEPNSKAVIIDSTSNDKRYIFTFVISGGILSEIHHKNPGDFTFVVYTPVAYAQAQGTHFYASYMSSNNTSSIDVFDGNVVVYNIADFSDPVQLPPGYMTTVVYTSRPTQPEKIQPRQFRRVGYMFTPDVCEKYEIAFGFPVVPIPMPPPMMLPPVPVQEVYNEPENRPSHREHPHNNVNVNVSVNAPLPGFPGLPVPVPMFPTPRPHHNHHQGPMGGPFPPALLPPVVAPVPVPLPVPFVAAPIPGMMGQAGCPHQPPHPRQQGQRQQQVQQRQGQGQQQQGQQPINTNHPHGDRH